MTRELALNIFFSDSLDNYLTAVEHFNLSESLLQVKLEIKQLYCRIGTPNNGLISSEISYAYRTMHDSHNEAKSALRMLSFPCLNTDFVGAGIDPNELDVQHRALIRKGSVILQ